MTLNPSVPARSPSVLTAPSSHATPDPAELRRAPPSRQAQEDRLDVMWTVFDALPDLNAAEQATPDAPDPARIPDETPAQARAQVLVRTLSQELGQHLNSEQTEMLHLSLSLQHRLGSHQTHALQQVQIQGQKTLRNEERTELTALRLHYPRVKHELENLKRQAVQTPVPVKVTPIGLSNRATKRARASLPGSDQALLCALKERDALAVRAERLEQRLSNTVELQSDERLMLSLNIASNRERYVLLTHFKSRLAERFQVTLSYPEVLELNAHSKTLRVSGYTHRGTPFCTLSLEGAAVYGVLTPDDSGQLTLTTAYTQEMISGEHHVF